MTGTMVHPSRAPARNRGETRRYPLGGLAAYIVVISFLVALWALTGAGLLLAGVRHRRLGRVGRGSGSGGTASEIWSSTVNVDCRPQG